MSLSATHLEAVPEEHLAGATHPQELQVQKRRIPLRDLELVRVYRVPEELWPCLDEFGDVFYVSRVHEFDTFDFERLKYGFDAHFRDFGKIAVLTLSNSHLKALKSI